ncbi:uncharacterized protein LOC123717979 isoform X3 [Pieris brassicae]|uniref:uncharacterized protein LOC123717979 isoform X3 n=1 Tax=Pieris brassicae TaxID=7116 RepID=UPI001E660D3D|nr:uncharacterized protein LOC123717979 isoform X3 [Pieris brassicae]
MALTAKQRAKRYREKLKENPAQYEAHKKKELKRLKKCQKKINNLSEEDKAKKRQLWRNQKQKQRSNKKQENISRSLSETTPNATPQNLGKAISYKTKLDKIQSLYENALKKIEKLQKTRVTQEQRKVLLEFMMEHPDVSQGRLPGAESARKKDEIIKELACHLNALESGATKTPEKWWKATRQDTDYTSDCASEPLMDFESNEVFNTLEEWCNSKKRKAESRRTPKQETNSGSEDEESIVLDPDSELWGFFDKQPHNKAKCSMCDERLRRDADTLYKHLKEKHSKISENLEYKDNEENFTEVIYLEEPLESIKEDQDKVLFEVQPKAKKTFKRRYSTRDDVKYIEPNKSQSKDDVEIENFGKYITGLLKGVPRAASSKLQMEIVTLIMNTKINLQTTPDIDREVGERSKEIDPPDIGQENQENQDKLDTTTSSEFETNQDTRAPKRPKRRISYREEYSYKINLTENEEREIENFGTYVTCLLKTVPENKISAKLQMNIVNLIMTARLQALQKNDTPVLTINGTIVLDNTNVDDNQVMLTDS